MAGMKLKNGADLCGFELRRFTIQNDSSDPTDLKVGRKYFNNGGGTAHLRERIYVGDKSITTDGWRDAAYMDDIKRLEGIIGSLDGNVGDNLLGLAEQLNAVQAKVDAFLEGDVDADAVLENLNELKQFLDTYSGDVTLSQVLNDINEEVAKKADKATTLEGYGITDAVERKDYVSLEDIKATEKFLMGYGNPDGGWKTYSAGLVSKVHDNGFALQGAGNVLYFRGVTSSSWDDKWHAILHEDNYSNFLDSVYLKQSGGTLTNANSIVLSINSNQDAETALEIRRKGSIAAYFGHYDALGTYMFNWASKKFLYITDGGDLKYGVAGADGFNILHTGNYASILDNAYLKLSGGTITGLLTLKPQGYHAIDIVSPDNNLAQITMSTNDTLRGILQYNANFGFGFHHSDCGGLYVASDGVPKYVDSSNAKYPILHEGNYNLYAPTLTGTGASGTWGIDISGSATKLATARSLWGNSFDGTADVNTHLTFNANDTALAAWKKDGSSASIFLQVNPDRHVLIGQGTARENGGLYLYGNDIRMCYGNAGSSNNTAMLINSLGNVTIGGSDLASTDFKFMVNGDILATSHIRTHELRIGFNQADLDWVRKQLYYTKIGYVAEGTGAGYQNLAMTFSTMHNTTAEGTEVERMRISSNGNVGIGRVPETKLDVAGIIRCDSHLWVTGVYGGFSLYSGIRDGEILSLEGLDANGAWARHCLKVFTDGNIHIGAGTTNKGFKLDVAGTAYISSRLLVGGATDDGTTALKVSGYIKATADISANGYEAHSYFGFNQQADWYGLTKYTADGYDGVCLAGFGGIKLKAYTGTSVFPSSDGVINLGDATHTWKNVFAKESIKIGDATLSWDSVNNALKVDKSFYSTEEVSAGGVGSGTTSGGGGGTNNTKAFDIPIGTESMTFAHNLGTKDVIVAIYEISDSYQQVLADVIINNISEVTIMFGEATEVAHRVVIMG